MSSISSWVGSIGAPLSFTQWQGQDYQNDSPSAVRRRSEEHTSELQSRFDLVCRLLLEKKKHYRSYLNQFMGCHIGDVRGNAVLLSRTAPADEDPAQSTATPLLPKHTCVRFGPNEPLGI